MQVRVTKRVHPTSTLASGSSALPMWNASSRVPATKTAQASSLPTSVDAKQRRAATSKPSRVGPQRSSTPQPASSRMESTVGMKSPDAYELLRLSTPSITSASDSVYHLFLSGTVGGGSQPPLSTFSEEQFCGSAMDEDIERQLHEAQLRIAATRELLRTTMNPTTADARRQVHQHGAGVGGARQLRVDVDSKLETKRSVSSVGAVVGSSGPWQPPSLVIQFPWGKDSELCDSETGRGESDDERRAGGSSSNRNRSGASAKVARAIPSSVAKYARSIMSRSTSTTIPSQVRSRSVANESFGGAPGISVALSADSQAEDIHNRAAARRQGSASTAVLMSPPQDTDDSAWHRWGEQDTDVSGIPSRMQPAAASPALVQTPRNEGHRRQEDDASSKSALAHTVPLHLAQQRFPLHADVRRSVVESLNFYATAAPVTLPAAMGPMRSGNLDDLLLAFGHAV